MPLTKADGNALMERLLKGGLRAADLTMSEEILTGNRAARVPTYRITHTPTDSKFHLTGPRLTDPLAVWTGSIRSGTNRSMPYRLRTWQEVLITAQRWASETAEWERTPDLWTLGAETLPDAPDNSPFTDAERDEIASCLDDITHDVREQFELPGDQVAAIAQTVEDLKEASGRVGRKDWKLVFYGALVSLGMDHAVSSGAVQMLYRLAAETLGHLFGAGSPPMISA